MYKLVSIAIICLLAGFIVGSQFTRTQELNWCVQTGIKFIEIEGYNLSVNTQLVTTALALYRGKFDKFINGTAFK